MVFNASPIEIQKKYKFSLKKVSIEEKINFAQNKGKGENLKQTSFLKKFIIFNLRLN